MALSLEALIAGPALPEQEVYIESLKDTVLITPVPLKRYKQYGNLDEEGAQQNLVIICIAESLSRQTGMSLEEAVELNESVQEQLHPAAWDEISEAVLVTMFGAGRIKQANALAGNV